MLTASEEPNADLAQELVKQVLERMGAAASDWPWPRSAGANTGGIESRGLAAAGGRANVLLMSWNTIAN